MKIKTWSFLCMLGLLSVGAYAIENTRIGDDQSGFYMASTAVGLLGLSLVAAHVAAPESYHWQQNTISELGAQHYDQAWMMRTGFISFGSLISLASAWDLMEHQNQWPQSVPMLVYGLSMAATGLYSAPPFEPGISYSQQEATIHSIFANVAGIALTTSMLAQGFIDPDPNMRIVHFAGAAFVLANSMLFKMNPETQGVYQRTLWAGSLTWLVWSFKF